MTAEPGQWPSDASIYVAVCLQCNETWSCDLSVRLGEDECNAAARLHVIQAHDEFSLGTVLSMYPR